MDDNVLDVGCEVRVEGVGVGVGVGEGEEWAPFVGGGEGVEKQGLAEGAEELGCEAEGGEGVGIGCVEM